VRVLVVVPVNLGIAMSASTTSRMPDPPTHLNF
jgi:hypothetical protein